MGQPDRKQDPKTQPTDASENASEGQTSTPKLLLEPERSSTVKSDAVARVDQRSIRQATGPRTPRGKERSKHNALKHGIFSKVAVLKDEPRAEFDALLNGLREDLCPEGTLEAVLVEKLALNLWRQRRFLITELAAKDCGTAATYWVNVPEMDLRLRYASSPYCDFDRTMSQLERV